MRRVWVGSRRPGLVTPPQPGGARPARAPPWLPCAPSRPARSALPSFRPGLRLPARPHGRVSSPAPASCTRCGPPLLPSPTPALSVRVPLCRCGSAASQGPGLASALCRGHSALCCPLPPSVAAPASDQRWPSCPGRPCPILRRLRAARPPRASAVVRRRAPSRCPGTSRRWARPRTRARLRLSRLLTAAGPG